MLPWQSRLDLTWTTLKYHVCSRLRAHYETFDVINKLTSMHEYNTHLLRQFWSRSSSTPCEFGLQFCIVLPLSSTELNLTRVLHEVEWESDDSSRKLRRFVDRSVRGGVSVGLRAVRAKLHHERSQFSWQREKKAAFSIPIPFSRCLTADAPSVGVPVGGPQNAAADASEAIAASWLEREHCFKPFLTSFFSHLFLRPTRENPSRSSCPWRIERWHREKR